MLSCFVLVEQAPVQWIAEYYLMALRGIWLHRHGSSFVLRQETRASGEQSGLRVLCESHSSIARYELVRNSYLWSLVAFATTWGLSWGQLVGKWHNCASRSIFISRYLLASAYHFPYTVDDEPYIWQIGTFHEA